MDENQDRVKIRVRVKERIPGGERRGRRRPDTALWIIATVLLGACFGYFVANQLLRVLRTPEVEYAPYDELVIMSSREKLILEHEDLIPTPTPIPTPENP